MLVQELGIGESFLGVPGEKVRESRSADRGGLRSCKELHKVRGEAGAWKGERGPGPGGRVFQGHTI